VREATPAGSTIGICVPLIGGLDAILLGRRLDLDRLPTDPVFLQQVVRDLATALEQRNEEVEKLRGYLAKLKRLKFGRSSETRDPGQLALAFEEIEADIGALSDARQPEAPSPEDKSPAKRGRRPLPDHLPREEQRHEPEGCSCPNCGGALHRIGEDVSEVLDYVPAQGEIMNR